MGGELITTVGLFGSPPLWNTPVALSAPHPSKGRGPGKGGGVKENCHKTIYSQRGNKMFPTWEYLSDEVHELRTLVTLGGWIAIGMNLL